MYLTAMWAWAYCRLTSSPLLAFQSRRLSKDLSANSVPACAFAAARSAE